VIENIISALSGLGLFLYAMVLMETAMKEAAGRSFKKMLERSTSTLFRSIALGAFVTAVVQSSSIVSLIVLSLVGAGLITLKSAIGVIFGANLGTTFTAWLVAILGFKIKVESFALPMAGIGGFLILFFKDSKKILAFAKIILSLGILFLGLGYMKESMEVFAGEFDLKEYSQYSIVAGVAIGFLITAIIQSSSASTAIFLTALYSKIITFEMAASLVIGANVGTTVTAILGAMGGVPDKKRLAAAHFVFNILTGVVALLILSKISYLILEVFGLKKDPTTALALFHSVFNLLGILLFAPFIGILAKFLNKFFKKTKKTNIKFIDKVPPDVPEVAIESLKKEAANLFFLVLEFGLLIINTKAKYVLDMKLSTKEILDKNKDILDSHLTKIYNDLKKLEITIISYAQKIRELPLKEEEYKEIEDIVFAVERSIFGAKSLKDIKEDLDKFATSVNDEEFEIYQHFRKRIIKLFKNFTRSYKGEDRIKKVMRNYEMIIKDNEEAIQSIALWIKEYNLNEESASNILNINRAIYLSSKNLLESASKLFLPESFSLSDKTQNEEIKSDLEDKENLPLSDNEETQQPHIEKKEN
jgi:phosphate:Na+ symporter